MAKINISRELYIKNKTKKVSDQIFLQAIKMENRS